MSTLDPQSILINGAWVRSNLQKDEDPVILFERKMLNSRREDAMHKKDYWDRQIRDCEKEIRRLDKQVEAVALLKKAAPPEPGTGGE